MPTWPASLPQHPLIKEYAETPQSNVIRSQMDVGPAKTRRRSTATTTDAEVVYLLTGPQRQTFLDWLNNDIAGGALPFDWPRPRAGVESVLIKGDPPYNMEPAGQKWRLSMTLEIQP
ncbi:hypothetical protein [Halomonas caseinilytica]|uniref:hypothetical protein n=1 Tax=Halomonas caseinilytica TaxID=438744 RepID=UPI0008483945|nr:hypothetical protein [Halomonas caseinilytica]